MAYFVIAGKPDCPSFSHVVYIARYLEEHLPNFSAHIEQKKTGNWEPWLEEVNFKNKWHHASSPLIWKELSMRGGIPHYVGGLNEFWEYCYDYYGLESFMSAEDLEKMVKDNMQYFHEIEKLEEEKNKDILRVGILGIDNSMFTMVLSELVQLPELQTYNGLKISCYDFDPIDSHEYLRNIFEDISLLALNKQSDIFSIPRRVEEFYNDCELLIILGDYTRRNDEMESDWLLRNMSEMFLIADDINAFAKHNLKVILAFNGPICYNGNILIDVCTSIRIQNIVAITSDIGLGPLKYAAEQAKVPLTELCAPPIWGCVGINHFVDIDSVIIASDIYRPYQRVIRNKGGSTLPLGIVQPELRFLGYLIEDLDDIWLKASHGRDYVKNKLERPPIFAKTRALVSLLKLWYAKEVSDDIISLGVCSNGSFGIPGGIFFSQPVMLMKNVWVPFTNFPLTTQSRKEVLQLIPPIMEIMEKLNGGPQINYLSPYGSP